MPADYSVHAVNPAVAQASSPAAANAAGDSGDFSFSHLLGDLIDVVNPLQHLPVISTLYRHLTGDTIDTPEKLAGDFLYGGPIGFACSVGDAVFEKLTGKDVGDTVYAMVIGKDAPQTAVASAQQPVEVKPASSLQIPASLQIPLPDLSFLNDSSSDQPAPVDTVQRATKAYRTSQEMLPMY
jgi:hypothetical protein